MPNKSYTGFFLTLEGGDGCGKSSVAKHLACSFEKEGVEVVHTREPGGTPLAEKIRALLLESTDPIAPFAEVLLFLASRAQHVEEVILPALMRGAVVICERFHDSTLAYQAGARHLDFERVQKLCLYSCHLLEPDCTLLLDCDPRIGFERRKERSADRMEKEGLIFQEHVRRSYLALADSYSERIVVINAESALDEVMSTSWQHVKRKFLSQNHL